MGRGFTSVSGILTKASIVLPYQNYRTNLSDASRIRMAQAGFGCDVIVCLILQTLARCQ